MTRKKYTSKFKIKVVLETLKERLSVKDLAQKYKIAPQQIHLWKREFFSKVEPVFDAESKSRKSQTEEEKETLLKSIGQLKVDTDFLKTPCGKTS